MRFLLVLAFAVSALVAGCKTTGSNSGYDYRKSHEAYGSDGPVNAPSDRSKQVRNAFSTFQY